MSDKPKPCCVCLPEKDERDQCILFNGQESDKCKELVQKYKKCMKGFGFEI
ncbi:COX17 (YLL009C) [Zygosaccharomyces parabailii]|nr:COX17 (YLL009C) [Zygosaccharomyces parabailii]